MKLEFATYREKMAGCWMGKNIGGVLGAPFECTRGINDVSFYVQDLAGNPPPNDDLDLQLIWLNAVERYGRQVNASILGEYWLSYTIPGWVEYGAGKNNLRMGVLPPLSGFLGNPYKDSCGCFIRSEIWACLAPGRPELAVRYAMEDAIVDHADEGLYGEVFCAALQSAAFVESDQEILLDIGLSWIPSDCGVARAVRMARASHKEGLDWKQARVRVMTEVPGTFGVQNTPFREAPTDVPYGEPGYDAPGNIGLMIIGWLYGNGDFGESLCIANNCGEDTDCTCATLGALLGIIGGVSAIPEKWMAPLGDQITTCCINLLHGGISIPKTVTELTDRVLRAAPLFLGREYCDLLAGAEGYTIEAQTGKDLYANPGPHFPTMLNGAGKSFLPEIQELLGYGPFVTRYVFPAFQVRVDTLGEPVLRLNEPRRFRIVLSDSGTLGGHQHQWMTALLLVPQGVRILSAPIQSANLPSLYKSEVIMEFEVIAETFHAPRVDLVVDITANGRHSNGLVKVMFFPG